MEPQRNQHIDVRKILDLCKANNISQADLGRRIGLKGRDLITKRLANRYIITGDELLKIAGVLNVRVEELRK